MDLKFKASTIRKLEKETGKSLMEFVARQDLEAMNILIRYGSEGLTEEQADELIDSFLAEGEGKDTLELYLFIVKTLEAQGFLSRRLKVGQSAEMALEQITKKVEAKLKEATESLDLDQEKSSSQIIG